MRRSIETELKYSIDDVSMVEAWIDGNYPPLPNQVWRTFSITDRYFDAADGSLSAAGYGARLRKTGGRTTLTLKSDIEVTSALHRRVELEGRATQRLIPEAWPQSEARDRLVELVGDKRLIERVVVRQRRRERELGVGSTDLSASMDIGVVLAGGVEAGHIAQLEFELRRGRRAGLQRIAAALESSGLGRPDSNSKLSTAAAMADAVSRVNAAEAFAEAGRKVMRRHLLRMLDREIGARDGDELALKQMRVATRRLRATWRVFGEGFKSSTRHAFLGELRRIGQTLGAVRDLDVLLASLPDESGLVLLAQHWRQRRQTAFDDLVRLLGSRRYLRFVDRTLELTDTPGAGATKSLAEASVADVAPGALRVALDRMLAAGAAAADGDDLGALHALRIEGRRLRYSMEAFADVLSEKPARDVLRRVTRLQDRLGAMQDAVVATNAAADWLADGDRNAEVDARVAVESYIFRREHEITAIRVRLAGPLRGLSGVRFERIFETAVAPLTNPLIRHRRPRSVSNPVVRVLFLCVHNSARSQMAEGMLRAWACEAVDAHSAGNDASTVRPLAIRAMDEIGIDISGHRSKGVQEFAGQSFDYAVTVCDEATEACPFFPGAAAQLHWSFDDPSAAQGSEEERLAFFRRVRDEIGEHVRGFIAEHSLSG